MRSRLYNHCELDHDKLFTACEKLAGSFLMTYDNAEEVKALARKHGFQMKPIAMKNTHHAEMTELVIGRDLSFLDETKCLQEAPTPYRTNRVPKRKQTASPKAAAKTNRAGRTPAA
jgi:DNA adenine methylase